MRHPRGQVQVLCLIFSLLAGINAAPAASESTSLAQRLEARMEPIKTLTARFTQRTLGADNQLMQSSQGRLWLGTGARFKIETLAPFEQILISDGRNLWSIDVDVDQAVVRPLEAGLQQAPILIFNSGATAIMDAYRVDWFESDNLEYFVLSPRAINSLFEVLTISFAGNLPATINIRDSLGQSSEIRFMQMSLNPALADAVFQPRLPAGIDLIDDR